MVTGEWHAERAHGGAWCAVRTVRETDPYGTVTKVRRRRALGVPAYWNRNEVEAHIRAMVARGELD